MKENEKKLPGWGSIFLALLLLMAVFSVSLAGCDALVDVGDETHEPGTNMWPVPGGRSADADDGG